MDFEHCCRTCKWRVREDITDGLVCVNGDSPYCTDFTDDGHGCLYWEKREE